MSRADSRPRVLPSILDRLIDPDSEGTAAIRGYDVQRMIDSVRRDLEELLNTRQSHQGLADDFVELHDSLLTYGLPDFPRSRPRSRATSARWARPSKSSSAGSSPALRDIRAVPIESDEGKDRHVRFHIEARLRVDPFPEVGFETVVELLSGHTSIQARDV